MENEAELVRKVQSGDTEAFGLLYDFYLDPIYRFVYYKIFSKEVTQDLVSETFLKAFDRISSYNEKRGGFNSWLYQIARNTVVDYCRTKKTHVPIEDAFDIPHDERTEEQLDALSGLKIVETYLKTLPSRQREIIIMRVWEGKSFSAIAQALGGTENGVKMAFSRSIRQLRTECGDVALVSFLIAASLPFVPSSYYIHI